MFISQRAAQERLTSKRNVFRDKDAPEIVETVDVPEIPREPEEPELDDRLLDMDKLDALINFNPRNKMPYRGKEDAQAAIGQTSLVIGDRSAGALFGLSQEQTRAYGQALTSLNDITEGTPPKPGLKRKVEEFREILAAKAAGRLGNALDMLDEAKLSKVKRATNLSRIAKDMAVIVEKVSPKDDSAEGGVHFHIYKPEIQVEQNYQVVTVGSALGK